MSALPRSERIQRDLKALFELGLVLTVLSILGGGVIPVLAYPRPNITKPLWEFGPVSLLLGATNCFVYACLLLQLLKLRRSLKAVSNVPGGVPPMPSRLGGSAASTVRSP